MKIDGGRLPTYFLLSLLHCPPATVVPAALIRRSQVSHLLTSSLTFSLKPPHLGSTSSNSDPRLSIILQVSW